MLHFAVLHVAVLHFSVLHTAVLHFATETGSSNLVAPIYWRTLEPCRIAVKKGRIAVLLFPVHITFDSGNCLAIILG